MWKDLKNGMEYNKAGNYSIEHKPFLLEKESVCIPKENHN